MIRTIWLWRNTVVLLFVCEIIYGKFADWYVWISKLFIHFMMTLGSGSHLQRWFLWLLLLVGCNFNIQINWNAFILPKFTLYIQFYCSKVTYWNIRSKWIYLYNVVPQTRPRYRVRILRRATNLDFLYWNIVMSFFYGYICI